MSLVFNEIGQKGWLSSRFVNCFSNAIDVQFSSKGPLPKWLPWVGKAVFEGDYR